MYVLYISYFHFVQNIFIIMVQLLLLAIMRSVLLHGVWWKFFSFFIHYQINFTLWIVHSSVNA